MSAHFARQVANALGYKPLDGQRSVMTHLYYLLSFVSLLLLITFFMSYAVRILSWFAFISYLIFAIEQLPLGSAKPLDGILSLHSFYAL